MDEQKKGIVKLLRSVADAIEEVRFPNDPFIVENEVDSQYRVFLVLWQNKTENRRRTEIKFPVSLGVYV